MKAEILTEKIKNSLSIIEKIIRKNLTLPIINDVLFLVEKNYLKIIATNLESSIIWKILAKTEEEGKVAIPANFISLLVGSIKEEKIEIEEKNGNLILKTKNQNTQIQGHNVDDFPIIPNFEKKEKYIELNSMSLGSALSKVVNIPSVSQIRPEISGIYFNINKSTLKVVGTDSFRLAEKTIDIKNENKNDFSFILSQMSSKELLNILLSKNEDIKLYWNNNQILVEWNDKDFSFPEIIFQSRLINGEYPEYQEIIPKKSLVEIRLNREYFQNQIKRASLFSGRSSEIKINIKTEKNELTLYSQSSELGEIEVSIPADINIKKEKDIDKEIIFNYKFLLDGLNNIKSSEVDFYLTNKDKPALIKPVGDNSFLYILMPIKN